MSEVSITENDNLNFYNTQVATTESPFDCVSTTGISLPEVDYSSLLDGTVLAYGTIILETTGTLFQAKLVKDSTIKQAYYSRDFIGSLLSFLNIVNNNDGWPSLS
jgi:hypothetical protein